ncbi:MAG: peroxidase family protein [Pseudomonadota bacterium]
MKVRLFASALALAVAACSGSGSLDSDDVTPLPTVDAGPDQFVEEGTLVTLDGDLSSTAGSIDFVWTQVSGTSVALIGTTTLSPEFRAVNVNEVTDLVFRLTVTNGEGTAVDEVTVTITDQARINGPSARGIDDDMEARRVAAIAARPTSGPLVEGREVRTFDGTNNNLANPLWGASFIQFQRLVPSAYADGIALQVDGITRAASRLISNTVMAQDDGADIPTTAGTSDFLWAWAQFIGNDIDLADGAAEAADIPVIVNDPTFDPDGTGVETLLFNRSFFDPATSIDADDDDTIDTDIPREQLNEATGWLDGSIIYGNSAARAEALRDTTDRALLATSGTNLLPINTGGLTNAIGYESDGSTLFVAGDYRANEHPVLTALHTLFVREHNRLASDIATANPTLSADEVYERARRLTVAKLQIITYEEFLPALLGPSAIPAWTAYDDTINPSTYNAFGTAALRVSYSMQSETIQRLDASGAVIAAGNLDLKDTFYKAPDFITDDASLEAILRGMAAQTHQAVDVSIVDDLRNAFLAAPEDNGLDAASLILQRGRDHGFVNYNAFRDSLGLSQVTAFSDITTDTTVSANLASAYATVGTIDLFVGGLAETPVAGSQLGELFQTIFIQQFTELRDGDRFWWQNDLTAAEQTEVAGTTLADIIRANTSIATEIQDDVFNVPTAATP